MTESKYIALDITDVVKFGALPSPETRGSSMLLPLLQCACGEKFKPWDFILEEDPRGASKCNNCGRMMWFSLSIRVFQQMEELPSTLFGLPIIWTDARTGDWKVGKVGVKEEKDGS